MYYYLLLIAFPAVKQIGSKWANYMTFIDMIIHMYVLIASQMCSYANMCMCALYHGHYTYCSNAYIVKILQLLWKKTSKFEIYFYWEISVSTIYICMYVYLHMNHAWPTSMSCSIYTIEHFGIKEQLHISRNTVICISVFICLYVQVHERYARQQ